MPFWSKLWVSIRACLYATFGFAALAAFVPALIAKPVPGPLFFLGLPILLASIAIYLWTVWTFVSVGCGTPVPFDPPRSLFVHGLYRVVRNSIAFGFCLFFVGEAVAFNAPNFFAYEAAIFALVHLFVVFIEESGLRRRFGASYEA